MPINRLIQQAARDLSLTFKMKCRDIIMKVFGHEALIDNNDTANIIFCLLTNERFYRLNTIKWQHLALRKLCNPFKWAEFLLTAPLELLAWTTTYFALPFVIQLNSKKKPQNGIIVLLDTIVLLCFSSPLFLIYLATNLATNLITGIIRRFLAPSRYIIRPAIETAKHYPKSFALIVALTLSIPISLGALFNIGALPAILNNLVLTNSLTTILATITFASIAFGALLTKTFNTIRELTAGLIVAITNTKAITQQEINLAKKSNNRLRNYYPVTLVHIEKQELDDLDSVQLYKSMIPIIIKDAKTDAIVMMGHDSKEKTGIKLTALKSFTQAFEGISPGASPERIHLSPEKYSMLHDLQAHYHQGPTSTHRITEALHAIDTKNVELRPIETQDSWYTAALITGTESFFYPRIPATKSTSSPTTHFPQQYNQSRCE